ncbi:MAG TPA: histidine kinase [Opitutaceae bacterium]|nr:histidine kinase [Opitutaceae bacterium]
MWRRKQGPHAFARRLAALLLTLAPLAGAAAVANPRFTGTPLMRVWKAEDYGASLLNTRVLVAPSGLVYVANNDGLLEFDGERWRLIPLPREGAARALAADPAGRVWVFGHDDIARLEADDRGELRAAPMLDLLPPEARQPGTVNRAAVTADGVYARGQRHLMLFRPDGTVGLWPGASLSGLIWTLDGQLFTELDQLVRVTPTGLEPVPLGSDAAEADARDALRVFATAPAAAHPGEWILLTMRGPARWRGPGSAIEPLAAEAAALFADDLASAGAFLHDGRLVLGTERSGLFFFDRAGVLVQRVAREHGLPSNRVNDLAVDAQGGLWVALQEGLVRLDLESPLALHGPAQGFSGNPRRFANWDDQLYVAHSEGVSRRDPVSGGFHAVAGFQVGANRPLAVGNRLVAATRGLREIMADDTSVPWTNELIGPITTLADHPGWIAAGSSAGLWLIGPDAGGGWETRGRVTALDRGLDELLDTGDGWLWAVTRNGEVARVDLRAGPRLDAPARLFTPDEGIPTAGRNDRVQLVPVGSRLLAVSRDWIRRFDPAADRFVPSSPIVLDDEVVRGAAPVARGRAGAWLRPSRRPGRLVELAVTGAVSPRSIAPLRELEIDSMHEEAATRALWLAGQGALVSYDLDWRPARPAAPLPVTIRRVETSAGELLLGGAPAAGSTLRLSAAQDSLHITFAAQAFNADYRGRGHTLYRTRLEGLDRDWTPWSPDIRRDFTNLPYRSFRLRVQARTPAGREGEAAPLAFSVAAPWWLGTGALAGYAAAALAGLYGFVRWRTRALRRRAAHLESVVAARTEDLRRSNDELARLHRLELDEKIAARLAEEKARLELLRYQLNPHFLLNAFTTLRGLVFKSPEAAGEMVGRLAEFCRFALTRTDQTGGTVADEVRIVESYLATEQARWGEGLATTVRLDDVVARVRLPPFLLQPLVENAVKYGGQTSPDRLEVRVAVTGDGSGGVRIEVANTGTWVGDDDPARRDSTGLGLENLRQRLRRYYPDAHSLDMHSSRRWVHVVLHLRQPARDPFATARVDR